MTVWQIIGIVTACLVLVLFGFLIGRRGKLRRGFVWKKEQNELLVRPKGSVELLYVPTSDTENRLQYKLYKDIRFVKKGKDIKVYFSEDEVLALLGNSVPVVRCAECKWCVADRVCVHPDSRNPISCRPHDYCNEGERRR